jgi:hypothetical protein
VFAKIPFVPLRTLIDYYSKNYNIHLFFSILIPVQKLVSPPGLVFSSFPKHNFETRLYFVSKTPIQKLSTESKKLETLMTNKKAVF